MPTEIEKLQKRIAEETDKDIKANLQASLDAKLAAQDGESMAITKDDVATIDATLLAGDAGDWTPIGDVSQDDWDKVQARRVKGSFPAEFGVAYVFNEKNIAIPYVLDESAPFTDSGLIFMPISAEAAFKSKEILNTLEVESRRDKDGKILLQSIKDAKGNLSYPGFAGKKANVIYGQQVKMGVPQTFTGGDGKEYPSIGGLSVAPLAAAEVAEDLGL